MGKNIVAEFGNGKIFIVNSAAMGHATGTMPGWFAVVTAPWWWLGIKSNASRIRLNASWKTGWG